MLGCVGDEGLVVQEANEKIKQLRQALWFQLEAQEQVCDTGASVQH